MPLFEALMLAVGFSLGMIDVATWAPPALIRVVTAAMSVVGLNLGARFGHRLEILGGVILVFVGAKIVFEKGIG